MVNSKDGFVANDGYFPPVGSMHTSAVAVEIAKRTRRRRAKRTRISPTERLAREEDRTNLRKSFGSRPDIYIVNFPTVSYLYGNLCFSSTMTPSL